jgi:hypothetical protein
VGLGKEEISPTEGGHVLGENLFPFFKVTNEASMTYCIVGMELNLYRFPDDMVHASLLGTEYWHSAAVYNGPG